MNRPSLFDDASAGRWKRVLSRLEALASLSPGELAFSEKDPENKNLLHIACQNGAGAAICERLAALLPGALDEASCEASAFGPWKVSHTPIQLAIARDNAGALKGLLRAGAGCGPAPAGTNYAGFELVQIASHNRARKCLSFLLRSAAPELSEMRSRCIVAIASLRKPALLRNALREGADPNLFDDGHTPLISAALSSSLHCCKILARAGALLDEPACGPGPWKTTPLFAALSQPCPDVFEFLLSRGANPRAVLSDGSGAWAFLHAYSPAQMPNAIALGSQLIALGLDPNEIYAQFAPGSADSALHRAIRAGSRPTAKALLALGADPNLQAPGLVPPLELARNCCAAHNRQSADTFIRIGIDLLRAGARLPENPFQGPEFFPGAACLFENAVYGEHARRARLAILRSCLPPQARNGAGSRSL